MPLVDVDIGAMAVPVGDIAIEAEVGIAIGIDIDSMVTVVVVQAIGS